MADTLHGMAQALLARAVMGFIADGNPPPSRQTVYMSPIPADCEQIAVLFSGWTPWPGSDGPESCMRSRWLGGFSVIVTRCTPAKLKGAGMKAQFPATEEMSAAAKIASDDAESLLALVAGLDEVASVDIIVGAPAGGLQTVELNVSIPAGGV